MDFPLVRREQLGAQLPSAGLDALVVSGSANVTYLTGFTGDSSWLIVTPLRAVLVSDGRYAQQLAEECPGLEVQIRDTQHTIQQAAADTAARMGFRNIGFESHQLTVADLQTLRERAPTVNWTGTQKFVETLRMVKDASEQEALRAAVHMAERAWAMFRAMLRATDTEKDLSDAMEGYVRRAGGVCTPFPTIVAVGERSALPHAPPTEQRVAASDFLLLDWGACGLLYRSDLTRMIATRAASGKVENRFEKLYTVVLHAQKRALDMLRPGLKAADVDVAVRKYLEEAGLNQYFNHGLGHGIGLQTHEGPNVRLSSQDVLQAGMVLTIEPGVYLPGWGGIRIEDDVLITPDGCEVLSRVPKDLASVLAL